MPARPPIIFSQTPGVLLCIFVLTLSLTGCSGSSSGTGNDVNPANTGPDANTSQTVQLTRLFPRIHLSLPIGVVQVPGTERWWVYEKEGRILSLTGDDPAEAQVVADLADRVQAGPSEAGLLGLAFHPQFAQNGRVYVSYTRDGSPLVSVIARFDSLDGGITLDSRSEMEVLTVDQPYANHNGGHLVFGPDGLLYIGLGDGGSAGDPSGNAQNRESLLGKILRLDVDNAAPYTTPIDNPFFGGGGRAEIWAYGLRNPWRFQFDRQTGELWAADVGQQQWEEIDLIIRGGNYGWNVREGRHCYAQDPCATAGLVDPVAEYSHSEGCSITGGFVYRGNALPLRGSYIYGDFCSGTIWSLTPVPGGGNLLQQVIQTDLSIASFAEDAAGELLVVDMQGAIYALRPLP